MKLLKATYTIRTAAPIVNDEDASELINDITITLDELETRLTAQLSQLQHDTGIVLTLEFDLDL